MSHDPTQKLANAAARISRLQPVRIWLTTEDIVALRSAFPHLLHQRHIRVCGVPVTLMRYAGQSRLVLETGLTVAWASVWDAA